MLITTCAVTVTATSHRDTVIALAQRRSGTTWAVTVTVTAIISNSQSSVVTLSAAAIRDYLGRGLPDAEKRLADSVKNLADDYSVVRVCTRAPVCVRASMLTCMCVCARVVVGRERFCSVRALPPSPVPLQHPFCEVSKPRRTHRSLQVRDNRGYSPLRLSPPTPFSVKSTSSPRASFPAVAAPPPSSRPLARRPVKLSLFE
jgi:hypothetical protein